MAKTITQAVCGLVGCDRPSVGQYFLRLVLLEDLTFTGRKLELCADCLASARRVNRIDPAD